MSDDRTDSSSGRRGRPWLLMGSLALNVFLAAWLIVGLAFPHFGHGRHPHHGYGGGMRGFIEHGMDDPALRSLHERFAGPLRDAYRGHRAMRQEIAEMVLSGKVDRAELKAAMDEMAAFEAERRRLMHEFFLEAATTLPKEELKDLFPRMHRYYGHRHD